MCFFNFIFSFFSIATPYLSYNCIVYTVLRMYYIEINITSTYTIIVFVQNKMFSSIDHQIVCVHGHYFNWRTRTVQIDVLVWFKGLGVCLYFSWASVWICMIVIGCFHCIILCFIVLIYMTILNIFNSEFIRLISFFVSNFYWSNQHYSHCRVHARLSSLDRENARQNRMPNMGKLNEFVLYIN